MGVLNMNKDGLNKSKRAHEAAMKKLADQRAKDKELNTLRTEVSELKKIVMQLVEKTNADSRN